jgi:hypothetical protein
VATAIRAAGNHGGFRVSIEYDRGVCAARVLHFKCARVDMVRIESETLEETLDLDVECSCTNHHEHRRRTRPHVHEILVSSADSPFFTWRRRK